MFGRKKESEPAIRERYYVEVINLSAKISPHNRGKMMQDALNAGDAKGWKLVSIETQGQVHVRVIVWDTLPQ
jgi:hypothetical protein